MIFHEQPTAQWLPFDFKLLEAYQMLQDETCPKCGHPIWLCRSDSNNIEFKVATAVCYADRAVQQYEDNQKKKDNKASASERSKFGQYVYTKPHRPPTANGPLPSRKEFYDEMAVKAGSKVE